MKKILFGIFAHPDDEAFGPSATLIKEVNNGTELHLIVVTDGDAGANPDNHNNLGGVRLKEWQAAGEVIGAASMHALHYPDSGLCQHMYEEIDHKIKTIVTEVCAATSGPKHLSFMTFDQNGITGHLDHIAVSQITTHCFYYFKKNPPETTKLDTLRYFCLSTAQAPNREWQDYFMPIGRDNNYINEAVDVQAYLPRKFDAMKHHYTQRHDANAIMAMSEDRLAVDHFHVIN